MRNRLGFAMHAAGATATGARALMIVQRVASERLKDKACRVCGHTNTVRAHLFPRALQHDLRKNHAHILRIGVDDPRPRPSQSGDWRDDILCAKHEAELGVADRYGVEFARSYPDTSAVLRLGKARLAPNPKPELLVRFVHAVVWRHTAALEARGVSHWLGPYHRRIELALFGKGKALEGYVIDPRYHSGGTPTQIGLNPCPAYMESLRLVRFDIGGLAFHLKTDNRPFPREIALASLDRDPLMVITMDPVEITNDPHLRDIAAAAAQAGKLGPRWRRF